MTEKVVVYVTDCRKHNHKCMCFHCEESFDITLEIVNERHINGNFFCIECSKKELSSEHYDKIIKILQKKFPTIIIS